MISGNKSFIRFGINLQAFHWSAHNRIFNVMQVHFIDRFLKRFPGGFTGRKSISGRSSPEILICVGVHMHIYDLADRCFDNHDVECDQ